MLRAMALAPAMPRWSLRTGCDAAAPEGSVASLLGLDPRFLDQSRVLAFLGLDVRAELLGRAAHRVDAELCEFLLDLGLLHDLDQVVMKLVRDRLGCSDGQQHAPP